jgi:hypothetical protein
LTIENRRAKHSELSRDTSIDTLRRSNIQHHKEVGRNRDRIRNVVQPTKLFTAERRIENIRRTVEGRRIARRIVQKVVLRGIGKGQNTRNVVGLAIVRVSIAIRVI